MRSYLLRLVLHFKINKAISQDILFLSSIQQILKYQVLFYFYFMYKARDLLETSQIERSQSPVYFKHL